MVPSLCFAIYIGFGNTIDLETAVVAMIYFGRLYWCMSWLPKFLTEFHETRVSFSRIQDFLSLP
jgi:ABC-type multidrug transport system fused ATPase/permease subunit